MTIEEIRTKFDGLVEYYSDAQAGQGNTVDAALVLELTIQSIAHRGEGPWRFCDLGCGAGNFSVRLSETFPGSKGDLVDLSMPMLERATERVSQAGGKVVSVHQADLRRVRFPQEEYDLMLSGAALHHLRNEEEWERVFKAIHDSLKSGGAFFYWDLIRHEDPSQQDLHMKRWGDHLVQYRGEEYRDQVYANVEEEDTPESLFFITTKLQQAGFRHWDILHKNGMFASLVAVK